MNLNNLWAFTYIAEYGTLADAAKALYISESAVSRQLKALESEIGVELFVRSKRGMELTPAGSRLLEQAERVVDAYEGFSAIAAQLDSKHPCLSLEYSGTTFEAEIIVAAGEEVRTEHTGFCLSPNVDGTGSSIRKLENREIDLVIASGSNVPKAPGFCAQLLCSSQLRLIVPKGHPLAGRMSVRLEELQGETFVLPRRTVIPVGYDQLIHMLEQAGLTDFGIWPIESYSYDAVFAAVASHRGITVAASWYRNPLPGSVAYLDIVGVNAMFDYHMIWLEDNGNPYIGEFIHAARGYVERRYPQWA